MLFAKGKDPPNPPNKAAPLPLPFPVANEDDPNEVVGCPKGPPLEKGLFAAVEVSPLFAAVPLPSKKGLFDEPKGFVN